MRDRNEHNLVHKRTVAQSADKAKMAKCPKCGAGVPIYPRYSPWCDGCDWNLQPTNGQLLENHLSTWLSELGQQSDARLLKQVSTVKRLSPQFTVTKFVSVLLALLTYGVILAIAAALFYVAYTQHVYPDLIRFAIVVLAAGVFSTIVPHFEEVPPEMVRTQEKDFPAINDIVERVALALGVAKPMILMTEQFTATFGRIGFWQQPVLCLGHPFLSVLNQEELVSLIAHELSHSRDGAITRRPIVRTALIALDRWNYIIQPERLLYIRNRFWFYVLFPLTILCTVAILPIRAMTYLIEICCFRDGQLAEYIADASSLAVTDGEKAVSLLRKSHYRHLQALTMAYESAPARRKYTHLLNQLNEIPEREFERVWRIAQRENMSLRSTHPSLRSRVAFLSKYQDQSNQVAIEDSLFKDLHRELEAWPKVIRDREDAHNAALEATQDAGQDLLYAAAD